MLLVVACEEAALEQQQEALVLERGEQASVEGDRGKILYLLKNWKATFWTMRC